MLETYKAPSGSAKVLFSYDEDALGGIFSTPPALVVRLQGIPLQMHQGQMTGDYEVAFHSAITGSTAHYGISPSLAASLPKKDFYVRLSLSRSPCICVSMSQPVSGGLSGRASARIAVASVGSLGVGGDSSQAIVAGGSPSTSERLIVPVA